MGGDKGSDILYERNYFKIKKNRHETIKTNAPSKVWWCMPFIQVLLSKMLVGICAFKVSLPVLHSKLQVSYSYIIKLCIKKEKKLRSNKKD